MTVSSEISSQTYVTNGAAVAFPTVFSFLKNSEVKVFWKFTSGTEAQLAEVANYTLTGAGNDAGGTVTTLSPLPSGTLRIERTVPFTQPVDFRTFGSFRPEVHTQQFDESVFRDQQLDRRVKNLESAGAPGSVVAGNGLFFSGSTLHVGGGAGITTEADTVSIYFPGEGFGLGQVFSDANSADPGSTDIVARVDHTHVANTDSPIALVAGGVTAIGGSSSLARADHRHQMPVGIPLNVNAASFDIGSSGNFADASHKHSVDTATAVDITDATNAVGSGSPLALANHTHSHGARGGGSLHALATTSVAGFMSPSDKVAVQNAASQYELIADGSVVTTNNAATGILSFRPGDNTTEFIEVAIVGKQQAGSKAAGYKKRFCVYRQGSTALVGAVDSLDRETDAGWDANVVIVSPDVNITVTGADGATITWAAVARRTIIKGA